MKLLRMFGLILLAQGTAALAAAWVVHHGEGYRWQETVICLIVAVGAFLVVEAE